MKFISKVNKTSKELKNLRQEIDILKNLTHENVILLLDTFETETDIVMVMEFGEVEKKKYLKKIIKQKTKNSIFYNK